LVNVNSIVDKKTLTVNFIHFGSWRRE